MSDTSAYPPGTVLTRPDGRRATVVVCTPEEAILQEDSYQLADGSTVAAAEWRGDPADLANCWNVDNG